MIDYNSLKLLPKIHSPKDLRKLNENELYALADEIRRYIVSTVAETGGHLSSNLGVVELSIALHLCFDFERDRLIFDVGHQSYVHKLLTGRAERFGTLRQKDGISGFPKTSESVYDAFNTGHSSTSISAALGMLRAFKLFGEDDRHVVAVIGDGALTGGLAYEALDDAGEQELPLIVILNDNKMSISGNVGGMSSHLAKLRTSSGYKGFKRRLSNRLKRIPKVGNRLSSRLERFKNRIKYFILPNVMFEELGFTYVGPIDGHDIADLVKIFEYAKNVKDKPLFIHVMTQKGKGYVHAEQDAEKFHGIGRFDESTGACRQESREKPDSNSAIFANTLCELADKNERIVAITAAMASGTGLCAFEKRFPDRFFDVGIAEQHGVTMAAGMAAAGLIPVFAVYSTFLQRGYDQLLHDICLQGLHVVFGIDRAGLVGADGETHQGVYDIAYLTTLPNGFTLLSPSSQEELEAMLRFAIGLNGPCAIRYGRGLLPKRPLNETISVDKWEVVKKASKLTVVVSGRLFETAMNACKGLPVGLINARKLCPIGERELALIDDAKCVITLEDGSRETGFGAQLARLAAERGNGQKVINLGVPGIAIAAASIKEQDCMCGIDEYSVRAAILEQLKNIQG